MNFLLLSAAAPTADGAMFNNVFMIGALLLMVGVFFFMSRSQKKKEKAERERRNSIEIGDEITTIGGIVGRVVSMKEETFVLETAGDRSRLRFKRWAIQDVKRLQLDTGDEGEALKTDKSDK